MDLRVSEEWLRVLEIQMNTAGEMKVSEYVRMAFWRLVNFHFTVGGRHYVEK